MPYQSPFQSYTQPTRSMPGNCQQSQMHAQSTDYVSSTYFNNASAPRINTDINTYNTIKKAHPDIPIIDADEFNVDILAYLSSTGDGSYTVLSDVDIDTSEPALEVNALKEKHAFATSLNWAYYVPPYRRLDGGTGTIVNEIKFGKFLIKWEKHEFLMYVVDGRDGTQPYLFKRQYILSTDTAAAYALLKTAGYWSNKLHDEIWVFDQGFWQKDSALWTAIQKSNWEDIILPEELKEDLLKTILRFYDSRETYSKLHVPWKRGLIFYGPPGNGKTISIKATMKSLYDRKVPVPTLYVKSLNGFLGPEYNINTIFRLARQEAPCYLVFEDLDSMVTDDVRSFFLNAVDGLSENEGILMIGSTNHLERLDPGIAKRPSRFDRKYLFPIPDMKQRIRYCEFWQKKIRDNKEVEFPNKLISPISDLTNGFSFAFMQEAFVSTLLKIANDAEEATSCKSTRSLKERKEATIDLSDLEEELVFVEKEGLENSSEKRAIGLYDFEATEENEVSFKESDELEVLDEIDEDWWYMRRVKDGKEGLAPRAFFQVCGNFKASPAEDDKDLDDYVLWREIKVQIANLRKELDSDD